MNHASVDVPLADRVRQAMCRIHEFAPPEGYYVAFSGGKDSMVLLDLVRASGVLHDVHYNVTTVDPPELLRFIKTHYPDVEFERPEQSMRELIRMHGAPPTRRNRYCCRALKERGGVGRVVLTGVRWQESRSRATRRMTESCRRHGSKVFVHPLIDWTAEDIWQYITDRALAYCSLYDEGRKRVGCVMCPLAGSKRMREEAERWPAIAKMYRKSCETAFEEHLRRRAGRSLFWSSGDDMYRWWIGYERHS